MIKSELLKSLTTVGVGLGLAVGVGIGDGDGVGIGDWEGVGVGSGFGEVCAFTPLLQNNFLPFLMQVKVFSDATFFCPSVLHTAPIFGVAANVGTVEATINAVIRAETILRRKPTYREYLQLELK